MIFSPGRSKCPICNEVIYEGEEVAFPHFADAGEPFSLFSDTALHRKCFNSHPYRNDFEVAWKEAIANGNDDIQRQWGWIIEYLSEIRGNDPSEDNE